MEKSKTEQNTAIIEKMIELTQTKSHLLSQIVGLDIEISKRITRLEESDMKTIDIKKLTYLANVLHKLAYNDEDLHIFIGQNLKEQHEKIKVIISEKNKHIITKKDLFVDQNHLVLNGKEINGGKSLCSFEYEIENIKCESVEHLYLFDINVEMPPLEFVKIFPKLKFIYYNGQTNIYELLMFEKKHEFYKGIQFISLKETKIYV